MRIAAALFVACVGLIVAALPAHADATSDVDAAVQKFQAGSHVFLSPQAGQQLDQTALNAKIGNLSLYIAVVGANQNPADIEAAIIKGGLPQATIVVISGTQYTAQSALLCSGVAAKLLKGARATHSEADSGQLTNWLGDFITAASKAPTQSATKCSSTDGGAVTTSPSSGSILPWMILIGVLGLGGGAHYVNRKKNQRRLALRTRHAEVTTLHDQLQSQLQRIDPSRNAIAVQALADAAERHHFAGSVLSAAENDAEYEVARRACIEGLVAAQAAREVLGMDHGPQFPAIDDSGGERLQVVSDIQVGAKVYRGYPTYIPGAVHYFDGGNGYLAGWYDSPFWESASGDSSLGGLFGASNESGDDQDDDWGADENLASPR